MKDKAISPVEEDKAMSSDEDKAGGGRFTHITVSQNINLVLDFL